MMSTILPPDMYCTRLLFMYHVTGLFVGSSFTFVIVYTVQHVNAAEFCQLILPSFAAGFHGSIFARPRIIIIVVVIIIRSIGNF